MKRGDGIHKAGVTAMHLILTKFKVRFSILISLAFLGCRYVYFILIKHLNCLNIAKIIFLNMPDHFPCLLRIQAVLLKTEEKPSFADISLFTGRDTYYVTSALFCMAKRIAETFQVIE